MDEHPGDCWRNRSDLPPAADSLGGGDITIPPLTQSVCRMYGDRSLLSCGRRQFVSSNWFANGDANRAKHSSTQRLLN